MISEATLYLFYVPQADRLGAMTSQIELHNQVRAVYSAIAMTPKENKIFPCGRRLAEDLGYPAELLDRLPAAAVEAFCGVGDVSLRADILASDSVLDVGSGSGLDTIIAAGRAAKVVGIDFSLEMLQRAQFCLEEANLTDKVTLLKTEIQDLPLLDASIDVALVNGLFNLNPFRQQAFREIARVLRPGGLLYASELILREPVALEGEVNWFG